MESAVYGRLAAVDTRATVRSRVLALLTKHKVTRAKLARIAGKSPAWATRVLDGDYEFTMPVADRIFQHFGEPPIASVTTTDTGPADSSPRQHEALEAQVSQLTKQRDDALGMYRKTAHDFARVLRQLQRIVEQRRINDGKVGGIATTRPGTRRRG